MKKLALTLIALCVSSLALLNAQKKTQKKLFKATYDNSKTLVQSQKFSYVAEVVYNDKKRELLDGASNTVVIDEFDISGNITSLSTDTLSYDLSGDVENFRALFDDDKQFIAISFKVNTSDQKLDIFIDVKPNGKAFLSISTSSHNTVSWTGTLEKIK